MAYCPGCEHTNARHFRDIEGVVRCLVVDRGFSRSGVIGPRSDIDCDCADGVSAIADRRRQAKAEEEVRQQTWADQIIAEVRRREAEEQR